MCLLALFLFPNLPPPHLFAFHFDPFSICIYPPFLHVSFLNFMLDSAISGVMG